MDPIPALLLIVASFIGLIIWVIIYFALVERLLKAIIGSIFGVEIGGFVNELQRRRYAGQAPGCLRGWHITSPTGSVASGCLSDTVVWIIGGLFRLTLVGGAILGVIVVDLIVFFSAFTEPR